MVVLEEDGLTPTKYLSQVVISQGFPKDVGYYSWMWEGNLFLLAMKARSIWGI